MRALRFHRWLVVPVAGVVSVGFAGAAGAAFSASGAGTAAAAATTMPSGLQPSGSAAGATVTVTWPSAVFADGAPVPGYTVERINAASGAQAPAGGSCAGVVTATRCADAGVPSGTWTYVDTPVAGGWTGGASPQSVPVPVA